MQLARRSRDLILASATRTSDAGSITTIAAIPGLSITFTPDDRPFGVRLILPGLQKDASAGLVQAYIANTGMTSAVGICAVTIAASSFGVATIDLEPGFVAASGILAVAVGTPLTLAAGISASAGAVTVKGSSGGVHPLLQAYTTRG